MLAMEEKRFNSNRSIGTENFGELLADLGYKVNKQQIEQALDELDPNVNGEIEKVSFLKWFEAEADSLQGSSKSQPKKKTAASSLKNINSSMLDAKNERKRAQADVQLLSNRLAHLRAEEEKARKRIEATEQRAREIKAAKDRKERMQRQRQQVSQKEKQNLTMASQYTAQVSDEARARKARSLKNNQLEKKKKVQECKNQRLEIREQILKNREQARLDVLKKKEKVRKEQEAAIRKRQMEKKRREDELIRRAQKQLAEEHRQKILSEQLIRDMEEEEARLIASLKQTQEKQRRAYEELETAL